MSIKPIDYTNLISKSQETAKIRQVENDRVKIQVEQGVVQQEKKIDQNFKRVRDTNKSENLVIDVDKRRQSRDSNDEKKHKKRRKKKNRIELN